MKVDSDKQPMKKTPEVVSKYVLNFKFHWSANDEYLWIQYMSHFLLRAWRNGVFLYPVALYVGHPEKVRTKFQILLGQNNVFSS